MALEFFDDALGQLQDALPQWMAKDRAGSELALFLQMLAENVDALSSELEGVHADQALETSRDEALRTEWAPLYGISREDLPLDTEVLRAYLQARASEDGSVGSLEEALLALLRRPENDTGTELVFPAGGAGLTFPADGSGLTMFEHTQERSYLRFPADGSGLVFPADGSGLVFPTSSRLEITEDFADSRLDVTVRNYLVFDRPAFARAVARFRQAHQVAPTITETSS
jgi:hypothetical protein